ncbi:hypothetical protein U1Q18_049319, partial [Sarracenia purpurea var. burkii]
LMAWLLSCIFYLTDVMVYDFMVVTVIVTSLSSSVVIAGVLLNCYRNKENMSKTVDFILTNRISEPRISTDLNENDAKSEHKLMNINQLIKLVLVVFFIGVFLITVFLDLEMFIPNITITRRFYVFKFYPMWCPFEKASFLHTMLRAFQFFTVLPGFILYLVIVTFILIVTIETYNKFVAVSTNLHFISKRTFEEIHKIDMGEVEARTRSEAVCSEAMMRLDKEREILMDTFYVDFIQCLEHYQQLRGRTIGFIFHNFVCGLLVASA